MGFFKEIKDDLSQAVNELLPEEVFDDKAEVNTLEDGAEKTSTETVAEKTGTEIVAVGTDAETTAEETGAKAAAADDLTDNAEDDNADMDILDAILTKDENGGEESLKEKEETGKEKEIREEEEIREEPETEKESNEQPGFTSDEVTVITKGTVITGNITSEGSLEVMGTIKGDIECQGKLSVVGLVNGNCIAAEVYVGAKRFEGCITSEGSVKIGLGTVVIGDITGTSGAIAGAVKGNIDINGPVVIDSSAVIKGNIKAQSIQINNVTVIEGFCSLSYASIDIDNIFK